uniref:RING-type E3 ubiquitin transferase n=1 Tax=Strigamia maritima TaxID=126957 RepID=T1JBE1_STRMM
MNTDDDNSSEDEDFTYESESDSSFAMEDVFDDEFETMSSETSTDDDVEEIEVDVDEETVETENVVVFVEEQEVVAVDPVEAPEAPCTPPQSDNNKQYQNILSPESDGQTCTICFETWTNSGNHRLSSLSCGHVFGYSCIKRWLSRKDARCPTCNSKSKCNDIRVIFASSLTALDTAERDRALEELQKEKEGRRKAEIETAQQRLKIQLQEEELTRLRQLLDESKRVDSIAVQNNRRENAKPMFTFDRAINVCEAGESRVMTYASYSNFLIVSKQMKGTGQNYGYTKLNGYLNWSSQSEIVCHSKQIRDLAFNPLRPDGMLLTASTDKSLCLSNVYNNNIAQRYLVEAPVWSCTWSRVNASQFYAGLQNGKVLMFDTRNTKSQIQQFSPSNGAHHPNISVVYVDPQPALPFSSGGLLVGQMSQIYFLEFTPTGSKEHVLPIKGRNLSALTFDYKTRQILASFRPSSQNSRIQHKLCELKSENRSSNPSVINTVRSCQVNQTFEGGTKMSRLSRSALIPNLNKDSGLLACVGDESKNALLVWNVETAEITLELQLPSLADVCLVGNALYTQLKHSYRETLYTQSLIL